MQVIVLSSPLHDRPTGIARITVDRLATPQRDAILRDRIRDALGAEAPAGTPFIWVADARAALLARPETVPGTYTIRLRALDQQDRAGGSLVLSTADGDEAFTVVIGEIPAKADGLPDPDGAMDGVDPPPDDERDPPMDDRPPMGEPPPDPIIDDVEPEAPPTSPDGGLAEQGATSTAEGCATTPGHSGTPLPGGLGVALLMGLAARRRP